MKVRVSPAHTTCLVLFLSLIFMSITTLKSTAQSDSVSSLSSTAELQANSSTIDVALKWERSKEEDTINGQSVGTNVMAGLQLPTYLDAVWEGGKCTPSVNRKAVPPGYKWASWPQK